MNQGDRLFLLLLSGLAADRVSISSRLRVFFAPQPFRRHDQRGKNPLYIHYREAIWLLTLIAHEHYFTADLKLRSQVHEYLSRFRTQHIGEPEATQSSRLRSRTGHHAFPQSSAWTIARTVPNSAADQCEAARVPQIVAGNGFGDSGVLVAIASSRAQAGIECATICTLPHVLSAIETHYRASRP